LAQRVVVLDKFVVEGTKKQTLLSIVSSRPPIGACWVTNLYVKDGKLVLEYDDTPREE
jgi:hypothetical protein